jgi:hypothetical protein
MTTLAPFLIALKLTNLQGQEVTVGSAPLKINAEVRVGEVLKGEVCIVSWEGSSCFQVGQEHPDHVINRKYELKESACFGAIMSYWNEKVNKWVKVEVPAKCIEVR